MSKKLLPVGLVAITTAPNEVAAQTRCAFVAGAIGFLRSADVDQELERVILRAVQSEMSVSGAVKQQILPVG